MESAFAQNPYPTKEDVENFKKTLSQTTTQINSWFMHRRAKEKRNNPESLVLRAHRLFSDEDRDFLEENFAKNDYPSKHAREQISKALDKTPVQINRWFIGKRMKARKMNPAAYSKYSKKKKVAMAIKTEQIEEPSSSRIVAQESDVSIKSEMKDSETSIGGLFKIINEQLIY